MRLRLTEADEHFRLELREFLENEIPAEIRHRAIAGEEFEPDDTRTAQRILNDAALAVPAWPVEWGGRDWSELRLALWQAELDRAGVPNPLAFNTKMVGPVIATFGSEEQKRRFLPPTAALDIWWGQGFSEPGAGSDLASLRTRAVRHGDHYVVSGQKTWTTWCQHADWMFALVRTDPDAKKQRGISFLLIDLTSPGVTVSPITLIDGQPEVNDVFFDDVIVPAENLVGEENRGWDYAKFLLGNERVAGAEVIRTKTRIAHLKDVARTAGPSGTDRLADPHFAARVADLEVSLLALEATMLRAASARHADSATAVASVLKLRGSELQQESWELLLEAAGAAGQRVAPEGEQPTWQSLAGGNYLNHRKVTIFGGSSEVQRQIIASSILGL